MDVGALLARKEQKWPDEGPKLVVIGCTMCAISAVFVIFRLTQTFLRRRTIVVEDVMVFLALVFNIVSTIIACESVRYGFGRHKKDITPSGGNGPLALMYFFLFQITYKLVLAFNKLSFLTLYYHVFQSPKFRIFVVATLAFIISGTIAFVIATIFQCVPIEKSWHKDMPGHCINNSVFRWSWASYNTAADLWVCLMPLPVISRLQMRKAQRIGIMLVFALGLFVCVTSIIRMVALTESVATTDPTWGSLPAFIWSTVEASTGLICACLPSLKQPMQRLFPRLFKTSYLGYHSGPSYAMNNYQLGRSGKSLTTSQSRDGGWHHEPGTRSAQGAPAIGRRVDKYGDSRESQERIIQSGGMPGGITIATDIHVSTDISLKSDQMSLGEQKEAVLQKSRPVY